MRLVSCCGVYLFIVCFKGGGFIGYDARLLVLNCGFVVMLCFWLLFKNLCWFGC